MFSTLISSLMTDGTEFSSAVTVVVVADAFSAGVSEDAIVDALTEETLESSFVATVTEGTGLVFVVNNVIVWLLGADLTSMKGNISLWCYR